MFEQTQTTITDPNTVQTTIEKEAPSNITLSFNNNSLIIRDDDGRDLGVKTGLMDLDNSDDSVTLNWSSLDFNDFEIIGKQVTFASDLFLNGNSLKVDAESVIVNPGVTLSTRQIAGSDHLNAPSIGNSGNIEFSVDEIFGDARIQIGEAGKAESYILTQAINQGGTTYSDGNVTFGVAQNDRGSVVVDIDSVDSKIELNNATIEAGAVDFRAIAGKQLSFEEDNEPENTNLWDKTKDTFRETFLDESGGTVQVGAGVIVANAKAEVLINDSDINATDLTIISDAQTTAKIDPLLSLSVGVGIGVGITDSTARSIIDASSTINTTGDLTFQSKTNNELSLSASPAPLEGDGIATSIIVGNSDMESVAQIQQGATIKTGGSANVSASSTESHEAEAEAAATDEGKLGIALAISNSDSTTQALVDGNVDADGDVEIKAESEKENTTTAISKTGSDLVDRVVGQVGANNETANNLLDFNAAVSSEIAEEIGETNLLGDIDFGLSASVAIADDESETVARIGDDAKVASDKNLTVEAAAEIKPYTSASGVANSKAEYEEQKGSKKAAVENRDYAGAAAVQVSNFDTTAKAYIGENAEVDVLRNLKVESKTEYPYDPTITAFFLEGLGDVTSSLPTLLGTLADGTAEVVGGEVGEEFEGNAEGQTFTSWRRRAWLRSIR